MKQQKLSDHRDYNRSPRSYHEGPDPNYRSDVEFTEEDYQDNPTKQSEAEACDINNIMRKYEQTGFLPEGRAEAMQYLDVTSMHDFVAAQEIVAQGNTMFFSLPAQARAEFDNKPEKFIEYVEDAQNDKRKATRLVELGLANLRPAEPEVVKADKKVKQKADKTNQDDASGASKDE